MGFLAGVAGVARPGAQPSAGNMFELDAIAACLAGRRRPVVSDCFSGALISGLIARPVMCQWHAAHGLLYLHQQIVKGAVLLWRLRSTCGTNSASREVADASHQGGGVAGLLPTLA